MSDERPNGGTVSNLPTDKEKVWACTNLESYQAHGQAAMQGMCGGMSYDWIARSLQLVSRQTGDPILDRARGNQVADAGEIGTQRVVHAKYYHASSAAGPDESLLPSLFNLRHERDFSDTTSNCLNAISQRNGFYISGTDLHYFAFRINGADSLFYDPNHGLYRFGTLQRFREAIAAVITEEWQYPASYRLWCHSVVAK